MGVARTSIVALMCCWTWVWLVRSTEGGTLCSMDAVALFDFDGTQDDELPFRKGAILNVLATDVERNWYKAERNGKLGLVPRTYIRLKPKPWYRGKMSRAEAEAFLGDQCKDGTYLVRDSESNLGDFSVTVLHSGNIKHLKILRDEEGRFFLLDKKFYSLNELLYYHHDATASKSDKLLLLYPASGEMEVIAISTFSARESDELPLSNGDIVTVTDSSDLNWWRGKCNGRKGSFPVSYVERIE